MIKLLKHPRIGEIFPPDPALLRMPSETSGTFVHSGRYGRSILGLDPYTSFPTIVVPGRKSSTVRIPTNISHRMAPFQSIGLLACRLTLLK